MEKICQSERSTLLDKVKETEPDNRAMRLVLENFKASQR